MSHILTIRATVPDESQRAAFDKWYADVHLPDAVKVFGCGKAWRYWSASEPAQHVAMYPFDDLPSAEAALGSEGMKRLIVDFDKDWPHVKRTREILALVQEYGV